jgi:Tetratricopeptide repeat
METNKRGARTGTPRHANKHKQPGVDVLESRTVEGGGGAADAGNGDESKGAGTGTPDTLTSIGNLASTYWNQGRWKEAEELEVQVMETRKRVLGQEHPHTLMSMNNLALTWKDQGLQKEALALMEDCVQRRSQTLGPNHPSTLSSLVALNEWKVEE